MRYDNIVLQLPTRLLLVLLAAAPAAAQDVPPPPPEPVLLGSGPSFHCHVERSGADGTVSVFQFITPSGVSNGRTSSWTRQLTPEGIRISAAWRDAEPDDNSFVQIDYSLPETRELYRIRVQRSEPNEPTLRFESGFRPVADGRIHVFTEWGLLRAILSDAPDPRVIVLSAEGNVVRSDPIDPAAFGRAVEVAAGLRPELDAVVADFRNRCTFFEGRAVVD